VYTAFPPHPKKVGERAPLATIRDLIFIIFFASLKTTWWQLFPMFVLASSAFKPERGAKLFPSPSFFQIANHHHHRSFYSQESVCVCV
jgi:hypothetical protein